MISVVLTSILPVCLLMVLGAGLYRSGFLPEAFFGHLNRLGFWILLPCLLFSTIAKAPEQAGGIGLQIGLLLCACAVAVTPLAWLTAKAMKLPDGSVRALTQAAMRGNLAYTALPILIYTFGEKTPEASIAAFALAPTIPFYNFWAVLILAHTKERRSKRIASTLVTILRNPLIIGCGLGIFFMKTGLPLPAYLFKVTEELGRAALPCALLALGAGLTPASLRVSVRPALAAASLKLLAMPLLGFLFARAAGFEGHTLLIALLYSASPCAVTSYVMADQMGADKQLAGSAIALSTLLCLPIMFFILLLFSL
jgi:predicted permease